MSAGSNMDMKESTARWCVFPRLRRRFPSPSLVLMKGRDISLRRFQTRKIMGEKLIASAFRWHHICIIRTRECPYDHSAHDHGIEPSYGGQTVSPISNVLFRHPHPPKSSPWNQ